ncbi:MAG: hypothetical protein PHI34_13250 [Acidobacteriota bacterium]|nr:hypothetical protein [Acidobacteriota bacterium]
MRARRILAVSILVLAAAAGTVPAAMAQEAAATGGLGWKTSFQVEYFSRTIVWDEKTRSSRLLNPQGLLAIDYEAAPGLDVGLVVGYSLADWDGLAFRGLPFSIENQAGTIGGLVIGAELRKSLVVRGDWEFDAEARFTAGMSKSETLPLEGLAVDGQVDISASWMRIEAGPTLHYHGFELFSPYLGLAFDRIWGRMTMTETIEDLEGSEEKKVAAAGVFALNFGTVYEPSTSFRVKFGGTLIPFSKVGGGLGLDYGATVRIMVAL